MTVAGQPVHPAYEHESRTNMLDATQQEHLETIVRMLGDDVHLETARLEADQTLEVVLCRDFICFRPLRITTDDVDIPAALAGQPEAQQALQQHLLTSLEGML